MGIIDDKTPGITRESEVSVLFHGELDSEWVETRKLRRAPTPRKYIYFFNRGGKRVRCSLEGYSDDGVLLAPTNAKSKAETSAKDTSAKDTSPRSNAKSKAKTSAKDKDTSNPRAKDTTVNRGGKATSKRRRAKTTSNRRAEPAIWSTKETTDPLSGYTYHFYLLYRSNLLTPVFDVIKTCFRCFQTPFFDVITFMF